MTFFGEIVGPTASTARLHFAACVGRAGCYYGSEVFFANVTRMAIVAAVSGAPWCSFFHPRKCGRHSLNLFCHPESLGVSGAGFVLPSPFDTSLQRNSLQNFADVEMAPPFVSFPQDFQLWWRCPRCLPYLPRRMLLNLAVSILRCVLLFPASA